MDSINISELVDRLLNKKNVNAPLPWIASLMVPNNVPITRDDLCWDVLDANKYKLLSGLTEEQAEHIVEIANKNIIKE